MFESRHILLPAGEYKAGHIIQLRMKPLETYRADGVQYLVACSQAYGPYLQEPHKFPAEYAEYMTLFEQGRELARFTPDSNHPGPEFRIFKVQP
jgi:hypothetical protein